MKEVFEKIVEILENKRSNYDEIENLSLSCVKCYNNIQKAKVVKN